MFCVVLLFAKRGLSAELQVAPIPSFANVPMVIPRFESTDALNWIGENFAAVRLDNPPSSAG